MQRCKNWLQKGAFSCWLVLTNSSHTTWPKTHTHTYTLDGTCKDVGIDCKRYLVHFGQCLISLWSRFDLALISLFQPPFPRNKPVPFKGAVNRRNWLKTMSGLRGAIGYCYFSGDKTEFRDTGFAAVFAISVSMVKCCQKMLFVDRKMYIWSLAFHWEALCCKVMLIWEEHPAAMGAVPLGTATSAVRKRSSGTQALLQCLPSAFPWWSAAKRCSL